MILRMTEGTLRRAIEAGTVTAEQCRRNPDSPTDRRLVYERLVPDPPVGASDSETGDTPPSATEPPEATRSVLDVLAEALAEERVERQRLAVENADLRERTSRAESIAASATATANMLRTEIDLLRARLIRARSVRARPNWWAWWPW
jgi:hypothetical protein